MKLLKALVYVALTSAFFVASTGVAIAAPQAWEITHRDSTDATDVTTNLVPPSIDSRSPYIPFFIGNDDGVDGNFRYFGVGSGFGTSSNELFVTPATIETPQGHLTDTLAGLESTTSESSDFNSLQNQINAFGVPLNIASFMATAASTSPYIATSTFTGFMSGAMVTKLAATPTIQRTRVTTDGSGNYTWTFPTSFGSSAPIVSAVVEDSSSAFSNVQVTSVSGSSVTVHAGKLTSTLGILTLATNATVPVDLIAISA